MPQKIKIARLFEVYRGPTNYYLYDRMRMLDPNRFETSCIYLSRQSDEPNNQEEFFPCYYMNNNKSLRSFSFKLANEVTALLKSQQFDILHCIRHGSTVYGAYCGWRAESSAVITHVHGMNRCRNWRRRLFYRIASKRIDCALGCAENVAQDIRNNYPGLKDKAQTIPNSINYDVYHNAPNEREALRNELNIPQDAQVLILPGRLSYTKGHDLLIDAFDLVLKQIPNAHLLLVGEGELKSMIETESEKRNIKDNVTLAGFRTDVPKLLKASDLFVMSSVREGMPLTILEAMAAGIPVVATGYGGTREILGDGNIGVGAFVENRTPQNFAQGIIDTLQLSDSAKQQLITKADQRLRELYSHEVTVKQLENLYEQLLNRQ